LLDRYTQSDIIFPYIWDKNNITNEFTCFDFSSLSLQSCSFFSRADSCFL